jgi:hypothetical protein
LPIFPVGFVTAKGSPIAKALADAVNELIAYGDYTKIFAKWGVAGTDEITKSTLNPTPTCSPPGGVRPPRAGQGMGWGWRSPKMLVRILLMISSREPA